MSSRTRIVVVHEGAVRAGSQAMKWLLSWKKSKSLTYPEELRHAAKWKKLQYIFECLVAHYGGGVSDMLMLRETRNSRLSHSRYKTLVREIGVGGAPRRLRDGALDHMMLARVVVNPDGTTRIVRETALTRRQREEREERAARVRGEIQDARERIAAVHRGGAVAPQPPAQGPDPPRRVNWQFNAVAQDPHIVFRNGGNNE